MSRIISQFRRGSVLIVVLWVCLGLVSVTLLFGNAMLMAYRGSDNDFAGHQADQAIEGAARYVQYLMSNLETPGVLPAPATYENEAVPVGEASFWLLSTAEPEDNTVNAFEPVFGIVDEASKLNLNTATVPMLEGLPGMTAELAAAIVDWRDDNDTPESNGAESETYQRRQPSYRAKNAKFESIEELALLNGADEIVLYGEDANLNGVLDPNEDDGDKSPPADNGDGKLDAGILNFVTVFSREPNTRADGSARVDATNANPGSPLETFLTETFGAQRGGAIMASLGGQSWGNVLEMFAKSDVTAAEFDQISDAITTQPSQQALVGLVNVNTASETVLACIPGIGAANAATLVATRRSRAANSTGVAWILEVVGKDAATQVGGSITGRTAVVSADVVATGHHGRGFRRTRFIIDAAGESPQIIYRRNLAALGWPLGSLIRQNLAAQSASLVR
jgi:DNA uptake protein ComE-like DNA-binding protein